MQVNNNTWQIITLLALALGSLQGAEGQQQGCAAEPLSLILPQVNVTETNRILAIAKIASENRICLGIALSGAETESVAPISRSNVSTKQLLTELFPNYRIESSSNVVDLNSRAQRSTWLDYKLKRFQALRASLEFNSIQLFFFACNPIYPSEGGYAGDMPESVPDNKVGPLQLTNAPIREALNTLIGQSSGGGMWLVRHRPPMTERFPEDNPFWIVVPYGASPDDVVKQLQR